jgi:hypothetical protein
MNKTKKQSLALLFFSLFYFGILWGCGTGGDSPSPTPTPTPAATYTLTITLSSNTVTFGTPITATATLRDANGAAVGGVVVSFAATSNIVVFDPTSATALTNAGGAATVNVDAASAASAGATTITASASVVASGATVTVTSQGIGISVRASGGGGGGVVTLGAVTFGSSPISAYGTTSVSVPVLIDGIAATVPISVTFSSTCVANGKATITTPVTNNTVTGIASSTYTDNNCNAGTDKITAATTGATAEATLTITPPAVNNIQFISATPEVIAIKGAGSTTLQQSSKVIFKVVDNNNNGRQGHRVDFSITPASLPGGITWSPAWAISDANGEVSTSVTSGTIPTPVWVGATLNSNPAIKTQSNRLTITTGLPAQDFFSLSVQTNNIEGWQWDGVKSALTIIASDRLGNPVPDGTIINFITEGAQINPASCTTDKGTCSTDFISAEFRPANGRVTILAYTLGEKSFVDGNGNNTYNAGETFYDLGDPYIDANQNGVWDAGEQFIPSSIAGASACRTQPGGGALPFNYVNVPSRGNTCNATWGENYVRRDAVIVLSGSQGFVSPTTVGMGNNCTRTFTMTLTDVNANPMPAATTITIGSNSVFFQPAGATTKSKATISIIGSPLVDGNNTFGVKIESDCDSAGAPVAYPNGDIVLDITTPKKRVTSIPITVTNP